MGKSKQELREQAENDRKVIFRLCVWGGIIGAVSLALALLLYY